MITQIQVTGISYEVDEATQKYVIKRIGRLDRFLPRHARKTASAEVRLEQVNHAHGNKYEVEIKLNVPGKTITAEDTTGNMLAAVDIVDKKIQSQLRDYKQANIAHIGNRKILSRFKRSFKREL